MHTLSIVYAADDNYVQHAAISIISLFKSCKDISRYKLFFFDNNISEVNRFKILSIVKQYNADISFINIANSYRKLPGNVDVANLSISTYSRLFVADLLPQNLDRVLYLDCDTIVTQDLMCLAEYPLEGFSVYGVEDMMYPSMKIKIGLGPKDKYINAGVLLINLSYWRKMHISSQFLTFIHQFEGKVPHLDQGVINGVLHNKGILPLKFNVQSPIYAIHKYSDLLKFHFLLDYYDEHEVLLAKSDPVIIHFTSFFLERPWFKFCLHPKKDLYLSLLKESPFDNYLTSNKYGIKRKIRMFLFRYMQPVYLFIKYNLL